MDFMFYILVNLLECNMYGLWTHNALNHFLLLSVSIVVNLSVNGCGYDSSSNRKVHAIFLFGKKSSKSIAVIFSFFFGKPPKTRPKPTYQNRNGPKIF